MSGVNLSVGTCAYIQTPVNKTPTGSFLIFTQYLYFFFPYSQIHGLKIKIKKKKAKHFQTHTLFSKKVSTNPIRLSPN